MSQIEERKKFQDILLGGNGCISSFRALAQVLSELSVHALPEF